MRTHGEGGDKLLLRTCSSPYHKLSTTHALEQNVSFSARSRRYAHAYCGAAGRRAARSETACRRRRKAAWGGRAGTAGEGVGGAL